MPSKNMRVLNLAYNEFNSISIDGRVGPADLYFDTMNVC